MSGILAAAGAAGLRVDLVNGNYAWTSASPTDAYAGVRFRTTGEQQGVEGSSLSWSNDRTWLLGGVSSTLYIRCSYVGAAPSGDSTGSWLQMNVDRSWYLANTVNVASTIETDLTIEIASDAAGANILDSCSINLLTVVEL